MMTTNHTATESADSSGGDRPVVLVVDDEERIPEAFALWLGDEYDVRTATDGESALASLDRDVDVVLLDRQMPGLSGDAVLERIREEGYDCRVAMVTGVDADFDIVDLPFDDYVTKPVGKDDLREVVDELLTVREYDEDVRRYFALSKTRAALEAEKTGAELADSEAYESLRDDLAAQEAAVMDDVADLDTDEYEALFRDLDT